MVYVDFSFPNQNLENLETELILTPAKFNISKFRMEEEHLWRNASANPQKKIHFAFKYV